MAKPVYIGQAAVHRRIGFFFEWYSKETFELFKSYASQIEAYFIREQGSTAKEEKGRYWTNHTFNAVKGFYAKAYQLFGVETGIELGNETWYSYNLENDYGGRFAAFPDIMFKFWPQIEAEVATVPRRFR